MNASRTFEDGTPLVPNRSRPAPAVGEPFLSFYAHYGETLCGPPVSEMVVENGRRCQYFEHLALEEGDREGVRLKPLGRAWLEARRERELLPRERWPEPRIVDLTAALPRHPTRAYPPRTLDAIRYIVLHHTGASRDVDAHAIAEEHVRVNDWPGIGYHFVIDTLGTICRTQDLCAASYHARQFNSVSVGVAIVGDLSASLPSADQLAAAAELTARLLLDLGLPLSNVRGHREMVPTPCPGDTFLAVWKPRLIREVIDRLEGRPASVAAGGMGPPEPADVAPAEPTDVPSPEPPSGPEETAETVEPAGAHDPEAVAGPVESIDTSEHVDPASSHEAP